MVRTQGVLSTTLCFSFFPCSGMSASQAATPLQVYLLWCGFIPGLQTLHGYIRSGMDLSMRRCPFMGAPPLTWVYPQSLHGECLLCCGAPLSLTMVLPLLFLTLLFPSLLPLWHFLPFLKYIFTEAPPT